MFDVGLSELLVIGLVGLIVIGPQRLPEVARAAGRWAGRLRRFVADVKQDLDRELNQAELSELRQLKRELDDTRRVLEDSSGQMMQDLQRAPTGATTTPPNTIAPPVESASPVKRRRRTKTQKTTRRHGRRKPSRRSRR